MRLKSMLICVAVLSLLLPFTALAQSDESACGVVSLFGAWARATAEGAPNGAAFGFLVNLSTESDTLIGASTDVAEGVELHEMLMGEGDVMQMRPVEGGFAVMPNHFLELKPGGLHIMLINLTQPLEAGSTFDLLLNFERAGEVSVTVPVREMTEMEGDMGMGGEMHMQPEMTPDAMSQPNMEWGEACATMHVVGAWARPAAAGMPNSAAYGLLLNLTDADDTLVSANSDVAEAVELHQMLMGEGDVMQMRPVEGGIPVPAGGTAQLQPGGLHVMLIGLTQELAMGAMMELTLTFAESGDIELTVPIQEPMEMSMGDMSESGGE